MSPSVQGLRSLRGSPQNGNLQQTRQLQARAGPQVPGRASSRRARPIRPIFVQIHATRPHVAKTEAPRAHFRAMFQNGPCSKSRHAGIGTPRGLHRHKCRRRATPATFTISRQHCARGGISDRQPSPAMAPHEVGAGPQSACVDAGRPRPLGAHLTKCRGRTKLPHSPCRLPSPAQRNFKFQRRLGSMSEFGHCAFNRAKVCLQSR